MTVMKNGTRIGRLSQVVKNPIITLTRTRIDSNSRLRTNDDTSGVAAHRLKSHSFLYN